MEFSNYIDKNGSDVHTSSGISAGTVWFAPRRKAVRK